MYIHMYILSTILLQNREYFSSEKMAEEDNNLQGQGFVLRVQRTAHIEKWTKCYSKNLFPPFYQYIFIYVRIYVFIYL